MPDAEAFTRLKDALADRYRIQGELGRGGMAVVLLARDLKHGRQVAIKVLKPELAHQLGPARFLREISVTAQLLHPHIVPLYDSGEVDGLLYHVMPYVAGESLRERLDRDVQLPIHEALRIAREVADALAYAHNRGIVHRDIKPANILLESGHAFVMDFGVARAVDAAGATQLTATGLAVGTPAYMSPEQSAGDTDVDARADIYALGCVLYEMLAGQPPYEGSSALAIFARKATEAPPGLRGIRNEIPPDLERIVMRALALLPGDRFPSARAFAEALDRPPEAPSTKPSIAVLPFVSMSGDQENEYFADGITEDIIAQLAKTQALKVISRTSVMQFKNRQQSLREIGAALGVTTVLEGSVRRAGDRVRVVAQLIDAQTDGHLWAETYDRQLTDIFAIQSALALRIAEALEAKISPAETARIRKEPTTDLEAYRLYLRGRQSVLQYTSDAVTRGIRYHEAAIARDPDYALAHVALSTAYVIAAMGYAGGTIATDEAYTRAKAAAERAVEIDSDLGKAHALLAWIRFTFEFAWADADQGFTRALQLNPGDDFTYATYGLMMSALERWDEAIRLQRRARELDPMTAAHTSDIATVLLRADRIDEALQEAIHAVELHPTFPLGHSILGWVYVHRGAYDRGLDELRRAVELAPDNTMLLAQLAQAQAMAGNVDEACAIQRELQALPPERAAQPYHMAYVYTGLGDHEKAIDCLELAFEQRAGGLYGVKGSFLFRSLHGHPRFSRLLEKMHLA